MIPISDDLMINSDTDNISEASCYIFYYVYIYLYSISKHE